MAGGGQEPAARLAQLDRPVFLNLQVGGQGGGGVAVAQRLDQGAVHQPRKVHVHGHPHQQQDQGDPKVRAAPEHPCDEKSQHAGDEEGHQGRQVGAERLHHARAQAAEQHHQQAAVGVVAARQQQQFGDHPKATVDGLDAGDRPQPARGVLRGLRCGEVRQLGLAPGAPGAPGDPGVVARVRQHGRQPGAQPAWLGGVSKQQRHGDRHGRIAHDAQRLTGIQVAGNVGHHQGLVLGAEGRVEGCGGRRHRGR